MIDCWCLTPLSAIFQRPVLVVQEAGVPGENHPSWKATGKLYHLQLMSNPAPPPPHPP
jgi:hypothetical protein